MLNEKLCTECGDDIDDGEICAECRVRACEGCGAYFDPFEDEKHCPECWPEEDSCSLPMCRSL